MYIRDVMEQKVFGGLVLLPVFVLWGSRLLFFNICGFSGAKRGIEFGEGARERGCCRLELDTRKQGFASERDVVNVKERKKERRLRWESNPLQCALF